MKPWKLPSPTYYIIIEDKTHENPQEIGCHSRQWHILSCLRISAFPASKVHGVNMGPIWDQQDPGGPHVGP